MITVREIGRVFVKATRLLNPDAVDIAPTGIRHDRDFALVEADDRFISSDDHGKFFPLVFAYDAAGDSLRLEFPDGRILDGPAEATGRAWVHDHYGIRSFAVAEVGGPWSETLSDFAGRPIRLVRCATTGMGLDVFPITLVTTGSLRRLGREIGDTVEASRFRAGFVLENEIEHEEDGWENRLIRLGSATLRVRTPVPRCSIPGLNPVGGARDREVMKSLIRYRDKAIYPDGLLPGVATPGFAAYAEVVEPGTVRVGDSVAVLS